MTNGTGPNAVATTTYTDTAGRPVLTLSYPTNGITEYTWRQYDANGNRVAEQRLSNSGGTVTTWETNGWTYDGMNGSIIETNRDGAGTTNSYDAFGDVTNRAMPGGLIWSASYNSAGQMLSEQDSGGVLATRSYSYEYYPNTNPLGASAWYGRLWVVSANLGTLARTNVYDDLGRLTSVATTSVNQVNLARTLPVTSGAGSSTSTNCASWPLTATANLPPAKLTAVFNGVAAVKPASMKLGPSATTSSPNSKLPSSPAVNGSSRRPG